MNLPTWFKLFANKEEEWHNMFESKLNKTLLALGVNKDTRDKDEEEMAYLIANLTELLGGTEQITKAPTTTTYLRKLKISYNFDQSTSMF